MNRTQKLLVRLFPLFLLFACVKEKPRVLPRSSPQLGSFNYTFSMPATLVPSKKLKIKVLDHNSQSPVKNAVFLIKHIERKFTCGGSVNCDSIIFEDSVITDSNGEAVVVKRGNLETLKEINSFWNLHALSQRFSFFDRDSIVFKLWPAAWARIEIKNTTHYRFYSLFSPRLKSQEFNFTYQPFITINKDTSIIQRLLANQNYAVTLNLYQSNFNQPPLILKEFNQFIGRDTTTMLLTY